MVSEKRNTAIESAQPTEHLTNQEWAPFAAWLAEMPSTEKLSQTEKRELVLLLDAAVNKYI